MNTTVYVLGIVLQTVAGFLALAEVRHAPRKLPWLLIALSSLIIVARRAGALEQTLQRGQELVTAEVLTLLVSLLFFLGVLLLRRMFAATRQALDSLERERDKVGAYAGIASLVDADVKTVCDHVLAGILRISGSPYGFYGFIDNNESTMTIHAWSGDAMRDCSMVDKPTLFRIAEAGIWGEAVRRRAPLVCNEYAAPHAAKHGVPAGHVRLTRLLVVPFFSGGRITAVAALANRDRPYGDDDVGEVTAFLSGIQAVTDGKRAEQALAVAGAYNRSLIEASLDPLVTIGAEGKITDVNRATEAATGRGREALVGSDFCEYFTDPAQARAGYESVFRDGTVRDFPLELRGAAGRVTPVLYNAAVYRDAAGKALGVFAAARDVSALRRAEEARAAAEAHLLQEQKLAAVGTLANGVAHEINNPLTGVINYAQLVQDGLPEGMERERGFCAEIISEGKRIAGIVSGLMAFSGQDEAGHAPHRLEDLLGRVLSLSERLLAGEGILVETAIAADLPPVLCSAALIQQVVFNLLLNARDALDARFPGADPGKRIRAGVSLFADADGRWVRLALRDHGNGIPGEIHDRIFDPFFTTGDRTRGVGTGMGLSVSHGIAREHGGRLTFETWPGEGTEFRLDLPARDDRVPAAAPAEG